MKANRLFEKLLEHWPAKIICFGLALVLYMVHIISVFDRKSFTVPLVVQAAGSLSSVTNHPNYVRVTVRSTTENIAETLESDFTAVLDLTSYTKAGEYAVPISVQLAPKLVLMDPFEVRVKPGYVDLQLEEKTLKFVNVVPSLAGEVEHGYAVTNVAVEPATVQIIGPHSVVEGTSHVYTGPVNINSISISRSYDVALQNINALLDVQSQTQQFHVQVTVEPEPLARNFTSVTVRPMFLAPQFEVQGELPSISFDLTGTVPALENYLLDENAVFIDCSAIAEEGDYELPVRFSLPNSVQVENKSVETVGITVVIRSSDELPVEDENVR